MFSKTIIDSDSFLDMSLSTQALYFHLSMRADDDGFINNPRKIQRMIGSGDDELKLLIAKKFVIPFESGICVIKHWKIHNYIRNDRYTETLYQEEKSQLEHEENKAYTLNTTLGIPVVYQEDTQLATQVRLGKVRLDIYSADDIENLWLLYPIKKGKAQAIKKISKILEKYSIEELTKCIKRYSVEVKGKDKQFILHGSTFFNGRYEDYLDSNYGQDKSSVDSTEDLFTKAMEEKANGDR